MRLIGQVDMGINKSYFGLFIALIGAFFAFSIFLAPSAGASGSVGGTPGGSSPANPSKGHHTDHGHGWVVYSRTGGGPSAGFRDSTSWSTVQNACKTTSSVIIYVIRNSAGRTMGYDDKGTTNNYGKNLTEISRAEADKRFKTIDAADRKGFTLGTRNGNVSWFCWWPQKWTTTAAARVERPSGEFTSNYTAYPGDKLRLRHVISLNNANLTEGAITATVKRTGSGTSGANTLFALPSPLPALSASAKEGASTTRYTAYKTIVDADVGKKHCQTISSPKKKYNDHTKTADSTACVTVASKWTTSTTTSVRIQKSGSTTWSAWRTSDAIVNPGDRIQFRHSIAVAGGPLTGGSITATVGRSGTGSSMVALPTTLPALPNNSARGFSRDRDTAVYTVTSANVGKKHCQTSSSPKRAYNNSSKTADKTVCVTVEQNIKWEVTPYITPSYSSLAPGQSISWKYHVQNGGPDKTNKTITYKAVSANESTAPALDGTQTISATSGLSANGKTSERTITHPITQTDVGRSVCRYVRVNPTKSDEASSLKVATSCVNIPYNYTLIPEKPDATKTSFEPGESVPTNIATGRVTNNGPTKTHNTTQRIITKYIARKGTTPNTTTQTNNTSTPAVHFGAFESLQSWSATGSIGNNATAQINTGAFSIPSDLEVGDRVCFATSVNMRVSSQSNSWGHSASYCITISKSPKVNILGGSLIAGQQGLTGGTGIVSTSTSVVGGRTYGSSVEHSIIALGAVTGAGSAQAYDGGRGNEASNLCNMSLLTFGRTDRAGDLCTASTEIGRYAPPVGESYVGAFSGGTAVAASRTTNLDASLNVTGERTITVQDGDSIEISNGRTVIINAPDSTVRIRSNVRYTNAELTGIGDIPQVVIIARHIYIEENVTNVDAWLIAEEGYINTCATGTSNLQSMNGIHSENCNQQLTVNGPVSAKHLLLRRTAGSTRVNPGEPAEVFNLRPDAYLWVLHQSNAGVRLPTALTTELPPRY